MADIKRYSVKEALNRIYRLFNGNTPPSDAIGSLPGIIYSEDEATSRLAELLAGSLPGEYYRLAGSQYGQLYVSSGTATQGVDDEQWEQVTGFITAGQSSSGITPNPATDGITINDVGVYLVGFHVAYLGIPTGRIYDWRVEWNLTGQDQIRDRVEHVTGTFAQAYGVGLINVTESPAFSNDVQLYVWGENGTGTLLILDAQLYALKVY